MAEEKLPHNIHDLGYKHLLSFWKIFRQLMEGYVEEEWKSRLDYSRSERLNTTFIAKRFRKKESDILYKVPLIGEEGKEVLLYVLIEHQSKVDFTLPFRILTYVVEIWKDFYKNSDKKLRRQKRFRFPPVFPIVLHNGSGSWTAAMSVRELIEQGELFGDFIPNVRYHLIDIPRLSKSQLKQLGNSLAAVFLLEHEIPSEIVLREALEFVYKETDKEVWNAVMEWVFMRLKRGLPEEAEEMIECFDITKHSQEEARTMLETLPAKLILEERRENIIQVLEARFEDLPKEIIRDKLNTITKRERLASLLKDAATVETLEEFKKRLGKG